jgi:hypothetical protein
VQGFFPAIETHLNTIAATVLGEPGIERLVDVGD